MANDEAASREDARDAIYSAVISLSANAAEFGGETGAAMLRDVAIAYRAAYGGAQVGGLYVDKR